MKSGEFHSAEQMMAKIMMMMVAMNDDGGRYVEIADGWAENPVRNPQNIETLVYVWVLPFVLFLCWIVASIVVVGKRESPEKD